MSAFILGCSHDPKVIRLSGTIINSSFEILVCSKCRYDADLQSFQAEKL